MNTRIIFLKKEMILEDLIFTSKPGADLLENGDGVIFHIFSLAFDLDG